MRSTAGGPKVYMQQVFESFIISFTLIVTKKTVYQSSSSLTIQTTTRQARKMLAKTVSLTFLVSLAIVCIAYAEESPDVQTAEEPVAEKEPVAKYGIITVEVNGKKVVVPQFRPKVRRSAERDEFDNRFVVAIRDKICHLTKQILIHDLKRTSLFAALAAASISMTLLSNENKRLKLSDKISTRLNSGLGPVNGALLERMLVSHNPKDEQLSKPELLSRMETVMDAIVEIVPLSNTGLVLSWSDMTVGGESLEDYLGPTIRRLYQMRYQMKKLFKMAASRMAATKDEIPSEEEENSSD